MSKTIKYLVRATLSAEFAAIATIEAVELIKETPKSWLLITGQTRYTSYYSKERYCLFDTAEEGRHHLRQIAEQNIHELQSSIADWLDVMGGAKVEGWVNV